jgi:Fe(3+) dicitrate transport protein
VGDFGYVSSVVSAGTRAGRLGILGTYVDRSGDGYREGGEFHQTDLNLKLRYDFTPSSWLATSLTYMHDDHQAPGGLTQAQFAQNRWGNARPENQFDGYRGLVDLVYHQDTGCDDWWEAFAYLSQTHRHLRAQRPHFGTPLTISDWKDDSYFLGVGARFERGVWIAGQEHRIYGGIRYLREWIPAWELASEPYPGGPQTPTQDAEYYTDTFSLHVDDTFEPICNVTVNLGARVEWVADTHGDDPIGGWEFDDDFFRVLPGIGVSWQFAPCWALYGNYFEGFRAPQVWGYAFTVPGASLEYEIGRTAEVGLRLRNWHGFSGEATGWRVEYDDFGVFYTGFYENLGRILATGADFIGDWDAGAASRSLRGLRLGGSITVQDSELKEGPNAGNQTPYAWEVKATWRASYERSGWLLSLGGSYVDESFSDDANTTVPNANGNIGVNPAVTLWDARLQKTLCINRCAKVILAIGATNLFDNDWYVHSRGGFFGGGLVAGPPRQGYVSAEFVVEM